MLRRGCLFALVAVILLCVVLVGASYFVFLPRAQDELAEEVEQAIGTQTARVVDRLPSLDAGTVVLTEESFSNSFIDAFSGDSLVTITPERVEIEASIDQTNSSIGYSGVPAAEDGRLVINDFEATSDASRFVLPADKLKDALEEGINRALTAQGLEVTDVQLGEGQLTLTTVQAS